jgi:hypothetical protein
MAKQMNTKFRVSKAADQCLFQWTLWWDEESFYMKGGTGFPKQEFHPHLDADREMCVPSPRLLSIDQTQELHTHQRVCWEGISFIPELAAY